MRHFLSPSPIAPGARGMIAPTARGRLVTLPGCALFAAPVRLGAASLTVDVAAIAARADQHLDAAARTKIQTRGCICLFAFVTQTWTKAPTDAILPRHACLGTVWGMAPIQTCRGWDRRRACLQRRQTLNSFSYLRIFASSSAASRHARPSSAAERITIPRHSARLAVQPSKQMGFSSQQSKAIAQGAPDCTAATAVGSGAKTPLPPVNKRNTNQVPAERPALQ